MASRERRSWTALEDQLLREAVQKEDPGNPNPSKWHAIAKHVPDRTNKDCRKRWFAKMASDVVKGGWAPDEDERLVNAIDVHGTRWSLVASLVQTRNSDQCAKRWTDTLNPAIDRTTWTPEADAVLIKAVEEHGKVWTKIVKTYFPGRTGLSAKNRYNSLTRSTSGDGRSRSNSHRKNESSASSSSSSVSPITPIQSDPSFFITPSEYQSYDNSRWSSPFTERSATSSPAYSVQSPSSYSVAAPYPSSSYSSQSSVPYHRSDSSVYAPSAVYNPSYAPQIHSSYPNHSPPDAYHQHRHQSHSHPQPLRAGHSPLTSAVPSAAPAGLDAHPSAIVSNGWRASDVVSDPRQWSSKAYQQVSL